jgi:hypothetical protein
LLAIFIASAALGPGHTQEISAPVLRSTEAKTSAPALLSAAAKATKRWQPGDPVKVRSDLIKRLQKGAPPPGTLAAASVPDPLLRSQTLAGSGAQPTVIADFDGIPATGFLPPDTIGAVGPNHYVQMLNSQLAVFRKNGQLLLGPAPIASLWSGFGGICESDNDGDPVVRYDSLADRWLVSQFATVEGDNDKNRQCIAISKGPDPAAGQWFLYAFETKTGGPGTGVFPDYPKIGVWPDAYYMGTQRGFPSSGLDVWAFERDKMLAGQPARQVQFSVAGSSLFLMPSDLNGQRPPPGTPNFFVRHVDGKLFGGVDRLEIFEFKVNWANPTQSTFSLSTQIPVTAFNATLCGDMFSGNCATQPGTPVKLETMPAWLMWRLQYRNFGAFQTLVANHTVNVDPATDRAGIRWYELRRVGAGPWTKFQEGTHAPDSNHRFMGSIAMDRSGNVALGYTASGTNLFPSVRLASRRATDPLGTLSGETTLKAGEGSQTDLSARWGDYSSMEVDPTDPCVFWYTSQYMRATSDADWRTRITAIRMGSCPAAPPVPAAQKQ